MSNTIPNEQLQLVSTVSAAGVLELKLQRVAVPEPKDNEVLVKIGAAPINPSDLGLLLGMADISQAEFSGSGESTKVHAPVPAKVLPALHARLDQTLPVGNEGAGIVVAAGAAPEAQALLGQQFPFDEAPQLPLDGCNSANCTCQFKGLKDRRSKVRRQAEDRRAALRFDKDRPPDRRSRKDRRRGNVWADHDY